MDSIRQMIAARNRESRSNWTEFSDHRARVTSLLSACFSETQSSAAFWGAGNCNDLDLPELARWYDNLLLLDLDDAALNDARQRNQPLAARLQLHGQVDLMGLIERFERKAPTMDSLPDLIDKLEEESQAIVHHPPVDLVASMCLLTQLIDAIRMKVGAEEASFLPLVKSIRRCHLLKLLNHVRPGGVAMLFTDFVSSETVNNLADVPADAFGDFAMGLLRAGNFFTGANPFALAELVQSDPAMVALVDRFQLVKPWKWNLGPRWYAVTAMKMIRSID